MSARPITREDLSALLAGHDSDQLLRAAFEHAAPEPAALLNTFAAYIQFNSAFGAGVANLAGEIAARQALFRDHDEPVRLLADRASVVAADFFFAAVDEFDDRLTTWRDTHRTLAQAALKGMAAHFGYSPSQLDGLLRLGTTTQQSLQRVWDGYGVGMRLDEGQLFRAMGFHAGSEVLADEEFNVIDGVLRARRPELVAALSSMKVEILGQKHDAYYWVRIHTSVEAEHFDAALRGANQALRFYAGTRDPETVRADILDGLRQFATVQRDFVAGL
jgi:hypothetical protein